MTSLEIKTRGDLYGNVKIINDVIAVIPWMTEDSLQCASRRHKQKIINNPPQQFYFNALNGKSNIMW